MHGYSFLAVKLDKTIIVLVEVVSAFRMQSLILVSYFVASHLCLKRRHFLSELSCLLDTFLATCNQPKNSIFYCQVSYQAYPSGGTQELAPVSYVADKTDYKLDIYDLFPGGKYRVMVTAWQNISGEYATSELAETSATLSKFLYAPNFEKVGRAYCFRLCLSVCLSVRLLTSEWCMLGI